jgi:hypothetical protein
VKRALFVAPALLLAFLVRSANAWADEPTKVQCVAASEGADELRRAGKLREARTRLAVCISTSCPGPVRSDCAERMEDLKKAIPTVVFEATDSAGNDLVSVHVILDGQPLAEKLDGTALEVDPGEHRFRFEAEGLPPVEKKLVIREADKGRLERIPMGASAATSTPSSASTPTPAPAAAHATASGSGQRTVGLVLGGVGVAGLVTSSIFGLVAKSTYDHALKDECAGSTGTCSAQGAQDGQSAHTQATLSTVGFVAGAALAAGGAVLFLTAPRDSVAVVPAIGAEQAGLLIEGRW